MKEAKRAIGLGIVSVLLLVLSSLYAITFNESRLVAPMDFSTYTFHLKDLPMLCSIALLWLYAIYLFVLLFRAMARRSRETARTHRTRRLNPKLGLLGFLGFLGLLGFVTYRADRTVYPFAFFLFFGFFGFFFEGKMSGTYMDERYRENVKTAQLQAFRVGYAVVFLMLILLGQGALFGNLEYTLIAFVIVTSLSIALVLFLSEYLLYRLDHDESVGDGEE